MNTGTQDNLFLMTPLMVPGNREPELWTMAQRLANGDVQVPVFQREFVWQSWRIGDWLTSVIEKRAIGVIVTYQVRPGSGIFLADGLQRLTSTLRIHGCPEEFGAPFSPAQWQKYCEQMDITVQHRHYDSHAEAMRAFQDLNQGTAATAAEYYKGELVLAPHGNEVYKTIPSIIDTCQKQAGVAVKTNDRESLSTVLRDTFALFYQYTSCTEALSFGVSRSKARRPGHHCVERELGSLLSTMNGASFLQQVKAFESYVANLTEMIIANKQQLGLAEMTMSIGLYRWLLHLGIWRKNAKRYVDDYNLLMHKMFQALSGFPSLRAQFVLPNTTPAEPIGLHTTDLNQIRSICQAFDVQRLIDGKTTKRRITRPGLDNSHLMPLSTHGEGPTVYEPSSLNRARGAKPIANQVT